MNFLKPPKAEKLIPFLRIYLEKNFALSFPETLTPFAESTENLIKEDAKGLLFLERLLLENFKDNFYQSKILSYLLSLSPLPGYLFKFSKKEKPPLGLFFKFSEGLYFYPLFFEELTELFLNLWAKNIKFKSYFVELKEESLPDLSKKFVILEKLGLTRLNQKGYKILKEIGELWEKDKAPLWIKKLKKSRSVLVVSDNKWNKVERDILQPSLFKEGDRNYYLFEKINYEKLLSLIKEKLGIFGLVPSEVWQREPFKKIDPLLLGLATLEHSKRAKVNFHILDGFTLHVLADLFYEIEDLGGALKYYNLAQPYTLQPTEWALSVASIYYALGKLDLGEKILKGKLCSCLKEDPRIHFNLGLIYKRKKDLEKAEYHFYKAYLLEEENPLFRKELLKYLWEEGRIEEVEEIINKVSDLTKEEKIYLGKIAFVKKDYERALKYLQEILDYADRDGESLYFLAWLYLYFKKDPSAAKILLESSQKKLPFSTYKKLLEQFGFPL